MTTDGAAPARPLNGHYVSQPRAMAIQGDLHIRVLLSLQRALVGEITAEMRAIAVQWSPRQIAIRVYTHGEAPQAVREEFDASVVTQMAADFSFPDRGDPEVTFDFVRRDAPEALPTWGHLVFARAETRFAASENG